MKEIMEFLQAITDQKSMKTVCGILHQVAAIVAKNGFILNRILAGQPLDISRQCKAVDEIRYSTTSQN